MVNISTIRDIIEEGQELIEKDKSFRREITPKLISRHNKETVEVLYGIRRSGKSTILLQIGKQLEKSYYINFEDNRLIKLKANELNKIETLIEKNATLLLDEVQVVLGWEKFVNRLQRLGYKVYVTGSNASLLKGEYATALTGRSKRWKILPFSFKEYCKVTKERGLKALESFLKKGGFPYFVIHDENLAEEYVEDIIYRDIITRNNIREIRELVNLTKYIISNPGALFSSKKISSLTGLSRPTALKFIHYLEEAFLIMTSKKFGRSLKTTILNPNKIYTMDNSFSMNCSKGRLLENVVAQHLYKNGELHYWKGQRQWEVDFVSKDYAIQVVYELTKENVVREMRSLEKCVEETGKKPLLIYAYSEVEVPEYGIRADHYLES